MNTIVILLVAVGGLVYLNRANGDVKCDCPVDNCGKQVKEDEKQEEERRQGGQTHEPDSN